jgi:hypothetical protein
MKGSYLVSPVVLPEAKYPQLQIEFSQQLIDADPVVGSNKFEDTA